MEDTKVVERLARIETKQEVIQKQLGDVIKLLDRMIRIEQETGRIQEKLDQVMEQSQNNAQELANWKAARQVLLWLGAGLTAVSVTLAGAYLKALFFG